MIAVIANSVVPIVVQAYRGVSEAARDQRVQTATAVAIAVISGIFNFISSDRSTIKTLTVRLEDAQFFVDEIAEKFGLSGLNITDRNTIRQKINDLGKTHIECINRELSMTRMLDNVNTHSNQIWNQSPDKVKASMSLAAIPERLILSPKNIEQSGMQLSSILDKMHRCHSEKVQCEERVDLLNNSLANLDHRAEKHHDETLAAHARTEAAKNEVVAAKDDVSIVKDRCKEEINLVNKQVIACEQKKDGLQKVIGDLQTDKSVCQEALRNCQTNLEQCKHPGFKRSLFCWI